MRSYFKFIGHDRTQNVRDVAPGMSQDIKGEFLCARVRRGIDQRSFPEGARDALGVHCPLPRSHKKTIHPPPVQSHGGHMKKKKKRENERKKDTVG